MLIYSLIKRQFVTVIKLQNVQKNGEVIGELRY